MWFSGKNKRKELVYKIDQVDLNLSEFPWMPNSRTKVKSPKKERKKKKASQWPWAPRPKETTQLGPHSRVGPVHRSPSASTQFWAHPTSCLFSHSPFIFLPSSIWASFVPQPSLPGPFFFSPHSSLFYLHLGLWGAAQWEPQLVHHFPHSPSLSSFHSLFPPCVWAYFSGPTSQPMLAQPSSLSLAIPLSIWVACAAQLASTQLDRSPLLFLFPT